MAFQGVADAKGKYKNDGEKASLGHDRSCKSVPQNIYHNRSCPREVVEPDVTRSGSGLGLRHDSLGSRIKVPTVLYM